MVIMAFDNEKFLDIILGVKFNDAQGVFLIIILYKGEERSALQAFYINNYDLSY